MQRLQPSDLTNFSRRYRFGGGRIQRFRLGFGVSPFVQARMLVRPALRELGATAKPVKLWLELRGIEEFRLQKRPNAAAGRISDLRIGYFQGLFFVNFDAWGMAPGETPAIHDFRASELYVAASELYWTEPKIPIEP